ncbi:unnamed protein product [Litomosoides sigmodontis]|uniref:SHSP domain-containing protein n=1 Tax=Litomosoides sigmodontis TaxID=42156 RepID=A0A3P6T8D1_LITSI|nr:unnamed protein product [Litomosoides sigmodontis]
MSRRASSPFAPTPTIFTDRWRSLNCLPYGILRFRNENFVSNQVGEIIDDAEKFSVSIEAKNFAPNEITVCLHEIIDGNFIVLTKMSVPKVMNSELARFMLIMMAR